MPVFNSLGSNYNASFVLKATRLALSPWTWNAQAPIQDLAKQLSHRFSGEAFLFYKGRQAITFALQSLHIGKDDQVLTQAFACWAIEEGILNSGAKPIYTDTAKNSLNLSTSTLTSALKRAPKAKALVVQHTLGNPADIKAIKKFCRSHKLFLIEDLAHAFGSKDTSGKPLGTHADAVILSFGRDKMIDAISGGACILKTKPAKQFQSPLSPVSARRIALDLYYPLITFKIRFFYKLLLGRLIHKLLTSHSILSSPISSPGATLSTLPAPLASLALTSFDNLDTNLSHRQEIANIYAKQIKSKLIFKPSTVNSSQLRYPILVKKPSKLINFLKKHSIYIADTWYKAPVDTGRSPKLKSLYQSGSCPNAEKLCQHIVNLPTHTNLSTKQAKKITNLVNQYYLDATNQS